MVNTTETVDAAEVTHAPDMAHTPDMPPVSDMAPKVPAQMAAATPVSGAMSTARSDSRIGWPGACEIEAKSRYHQGPFE